MQTAATVCTYNQPSQSVAKNGLPLGATFDIMSHLPFPPDSIPLRILRLECRLSSDQSLKSKVRVLVADNSRIHTRLLADALRRDTSLDVTAFESESAALVRAAVNQQIDVLVISASLDDQPMRGSEIVQELHNKHRSIKSVLLLGSAKEDLILQAFRAGARGLFTRNDSLETLSECVHTVHEGKIWANEFAFTIAVEALANAPVVRTANSSAMNLLSKRELQVVWALAEGLTNREIAQQLNLSPHTIKNYLFRIFDKLGVSSRIELLFMALSQPAGGLSADSQPTKSPQPAYNFTEAESAFLEKSAEAGIPAAQLALAQLHFAKGRDPKDLIEAYTWYLVATERALVARGNITKMLSADQLEQAKNRATILLSKLRNQPPGSADASPHPIS